ncbi:hypothetical protein OEZ86_007421 [Tetradesmus obliquus]|nr:hypothetical protein OEZ86_007421 [Tetradesmus obliquus]
MDHKYGADLTGKQFVALCIALCTGTLIEWFDFTIYSQLSSTITEVFFPPSNAAAQQLSYWAVFALGFIARPLGSILFGHLGDSRGRRVTLLWSILCVSVPTILVGCLPTYHQIGIAAPVLMAILRLVQGLAVGGEFGSAIVYLFETAPAHRKGAIASLGQAAIAPGIAFGLIACLVVMYACTPAQLLQWGWRVPFLLTAFFAPVALVMRMHMPEPHDFLVSKQQLTMQLVASKAASRAAASFTRQASAAARHSVTAASLVSPAASVLSSRQLSRRLEALTEVVVTPECDQDGKCVSDVESGTAAAAKSATNTASLQEQCKAAQRHCSSSAGAGNGNGSLSGMRSLSLTKAAAPGSYIQSTEVLLHVPQSYTGAAPAKQAQHTQQGTQHTSDLDTAVLSCEEAYAAELQHQAAIIKHHVPLLVLARSHWRQVLLLFCFEACYGATFYTFFSWLPNYMRAISHLPPQDTLWPILAAMVLFAGAVVATGHFICDGTTPKVWAMVGLTAVGAAICTPLLLWCATGSVAATWVAPMLVCGLLCGSMGGLLTSIGPQVFPAGVRTSGYNLAHNLAMSIFGGLSPMAISALALKLPPPALAAGVLLLLWAALAVAAAAPLVRLVPRINAREPAGGL